MKMNKIIIILCLSLISSCGAIERITHPDRREITASRVHLVDHYVEKGYNNFLFRGSDPVLNSNEFAYDELVDLIKAAAQRDGVDLPDDFYLIDVSLLFVELADLSVEMQYFAENPEKGEFVNYPVFGHIGGNQFERTIHIADRSVHFINHFLSYSVFGKLERKLKEFQNANQSLTHLDIKAVTGIRGLLTQKREKSIIVYVHCVAGCDRTGEVIGAYRMQYMEEDVQTVFNKNTQECGRAENSFSVSSLEAYYRYLGNKNCDVEN